MAGAVTFVMVLATIVTYLIQMYVLNPLNIQYLQTISFILIIAALVQLVEIILKKVSPDLYQALGVFLPLITTNCAISWGCYFNHSKRIQSDAGRCFCGCNSDWFWSGIDYFPVCANTLN